MLEEAIKKIQTQIKFGRMVEAEKALLNLLKKGSDEDKARVLPVFVDFSMKTGSYEEAARAIQECLQLKIPDELKSDLNEKLIFCEQKMTAIPYEPNCDAPKLVAFLESVEEILTAKPHFEHQFVELHSWEEVARCAHDQNIGPPFFSWNAVRTSASKETMHYVYEHKLVLDTFKSKCLSRILQVCERALPEGSPGYFYFDDIYADLSLIARGLLIDKLSHPLAKMKAAYEMSLFPCGWRGSFPEGELVIYKLWSGRA
jgi:hypothetical protein